MILKNLENITCVLGGIILHAKDVYATMLLTT